MTQATTVAGSNTSIPAVDWNTALACARVVGRGGPAVSMATATAAVNELRDVSRDAIGMVANYTKLECDPSITVDVVDRYRWVEANVDGLSQLLSRYEPANGNTTGNVTAASRLAGAQAGVVLSYVASKVLGQLEPFGTDKGRLFLVAPNIVEVERKLRLPTTEFRLWVAIHEATHLAQFSGVPWLRDHFIHLIDNFFSARDSEDTSVGQMRRALATAADDARNRKPSRSGGALLEAVVTDEQREALTQLQNLMTVLEGHAEATMDAVAETEIDDLDLLRRRFDHRRHHPGPMQRLIRQLLGLEGKIQQYARGRAFVDHIVKDAGVDGFNRIWNTPDNLPTDEEIGHPEQWMERINP